MRTELSLLLAVLVLFCAGQEVEDTTATTKISKSGQCPKAKPEFLYSKKECEEAISDCDSDVDCFGEQKCCNNGCAKLCSSPLQTGCQQLKNLFQRQARALGGEKDNSSYIPKCREDDGQFEPVQCNDVEHNCWCVDNQGLEVAGTRARSLELVNCTAPKNCAGYLCRMLCPYGFELDVDGCPLCECRNPCKSTLCPAGQECSVEEAVCSDPFCPPLPTCKRPRKLSGQCPFGEPLFSPDTSNPFLCGVEPNKPQCPNNYLCSVMNGNDYGVCCPLHEKPGECPKELGEDICSNSCELDMHCDGTSKCCLSEKCGKTCTKPGNTTLCQQQKQVVELLISGNPNYEAYIPQCSLEGEFFPKQCTANGRLCWCVDENGAQIRGSLGPADSVQCQVESRQSTETTSCLDMSCDLNCTLGYKNDPKGCQLCECYDPCKEISCPEDANCVIMKEDPCGSGHCPPIATCMRQNRPTCSQGSPLTNPATGSAVQCSNGDGCPVTHKCQLLPDQENGVCCPLLENFATEKTVESNADSSCPNYIPAPTSCDNATCTSDQECTEGMKCCSVETCGTICVHPKAARLPTMCEYLREMGMKLESTGEKHSLAVPIPSCRPDGSYEPVQCNLQSLECWCVDEFGSELRNTRANKGKVDCREVRALRNCHGLLCRLGCDYGFEIDGEGCPYCECRNPCTNAVCRTGLECQMQPLPCDSYWCPPVPQCIEAKLESHTSFPSCPVGRPLIFEENDQPVTCSPLQTYQQCPDTHMCVAESLEGPGVCCPRIVLDQDNINEASETREDLDHFDNDKPGQCPYLVPVQTESCDFNCRTDSDCQDSYKCCSNGCGTQCTSPQLLTACQHQRQIWDLRARERGVPASQTHLPACTPDGAFEQTQCDPASATCWCVDQNGWEVPGTRAPSSESMNCTNPNKCYPSNCDIACIHGLDVGSDGCYACSCRDPCKDIECLGHNEECRTVQVSCVSGSCPPIALCLPPVHNPCPWGEPLINSTSDSPQECGPTQGSLCPSSHKCHLSPVGEYALCCPKPRDTCYQEMEVGLCKASVPRWFFNNRLNSCEQFFFGGCGGNLNNFNTKNECLTTCPVMSNCERIREKNLKIKKTVNKIVFLPKCNRQTGVWDPIQCLDVMGLCWCVNKDGDQIAGSVVRGTPICNARASRNMKDTAICQNGQSVYQCPEDLCIHAACVAFPNATCRINPCNGCKVQFFDDLNRNVICKQGLTACLDEVQQVLDSPAWVNQAKSARKANAQFADSSESMVLDDGSIPLPPSYLPPPPPLPPSMVYALQQGIMEKVEESMHHETAIFTQEMEEPEGSLSGIRSSIAVVLTPNVKGFSLTLPNVFGPIRRMVSDVMPEEIQEVLTASKSGICPPPSVWSMLRSMSWRCEHHCLSDRQCPGFQKCCIGQCGLECLEPLVPQNEDRSNHHDSIALESNDIESPVVMTAVTPNCSSEGGFAIVQRLNDLTWCVDKYGRPHHNTLTRGTVRCNRNGTVTYREELGPVCAKKDVTPKVCRNECLKAYCPQHPEAVCVADPCQDCSVSFVNSQGEKMRCEDKCLQPVEVGQCGGATERFHFSQASQRCQAFSFSGCQGNNNNFLTLEDCQTSCEQPKPVCEQLKDVGLCRARIPRFFYNKHSYTCEEFMYGGCGGNDNNFASKQECQARCPDVVYCPKSNLTSELNGCSRSNLCANVSCPENAEAICTVDPCSCKVVFVETTTGNSVECQPPHEAPDIVIPLITSESRCEHLRFKNEIEQSPISNNYVAQCTPEGAFIPTQCAVDQETRKEECWCVDEVGIQLPDSDTFSRKEAKCHMVRIKRVEITMSYSAVNPPLKVNKQQVMSLTKRLLNRLTTSADDNMEVTAMSPEITKVTFSLSDKNKVDATFKLEEMVKTGGLMLQMADGRQVADYRTSHFYHISEYVPQDVEVFDNTIRETHMSLNTSAIARDNTITLVAAMLVITVVIVLLLLIAVMAFSSPIYGFITRKSQTKTNPFDKAKTNPGVGIQTVEAEYESIQNQLNKEKEPDSPPPSYKAINPEANLEEKSGKV